MFTRYLATAGTCLLLSFSASNAASVVNGGFETGDFTGWIATDMVEPFDPLAVLPAGTTTNFSGFLAPNVVIPSEGSFAANNGFDGGGPGIISLAQDIGIIGASDALAFDYRAGWDITFGGAGGRTLPRTFDLLLEPFGGGAPIATFPILTALFGTDSSGFGDPNGDTGPLSALISLAGFAGVDARINFVWSIPENFTGPGNAQLDNVRIVVGPSPVPIPAGLPLILTALGLLGYVARRRA